METSPAMAVQVTTTAWNTIADYPCEEPKQDSRQSRIRHSKTPPSPRPLLTGVHRKKPKQDFRGRQDMKTPPPARTPSLTCGVPQVARTGLWTPSGKTFENIPTDTYLRVRLRVPDKVKNDARRLLGPAALASGRHGCVLVLVTGHL